MGDIWCLRRARLSRIGRPKRELRSKTGTEGRGAVGAARAGPVDHDFLRKTTIAKVRAASTHTEWAAQVETSPRFSMRWR